MRGRALAVAGATVGLLAAACARTTAEMVATDAAAEPGAPAPLDAPIATDGAAEPAALLPRQRALAELVRVVLLPAYAELGAAAPGLSSALIALRQAPSRETLLAARERWQAVRALWRRTNAFGIGPGDDLALTGGIIDEPTDVARLEAVLAAETTLDLLAVRSLGANVRGFLALEHLLFSPELPPDEIARTFEGQGGARRALYLELLGADLEAKLAAVSAAWAGGFGREIEQAGRGSTQFRWEREAYDAVLNKALAITDRSIDVLRQATGGTTSVRPIPLALRSDNLVPDLVEDLSGLEALYTGRSGVRSAAVSIADLVREASMGVHAELTRALEEARAALEALPRPVRAQDASGAPVAGAISASRAVKTALASGVFTVLGVRVGFSDNDGD